MNRLLRIRLIQLAIYFIVVFVIGFFSAFVYTSLFPKESHDVQNSFDSFLNVPRQVTIPKT